MRYAHSSSVDPLPIDKHSGTLLRSSNSSSSSSASLISDEHGSLRPRLYAKSSPPPMSDSLNSQQNHRGRGSSPSSAQSHSFGGDLNGPPVPGVASRNGRSLAFSTTKDKASSVSHVPSVSIINEGSHNPFRRRLAGQSDDAPGRSNPISHSDSNNRPSLPPRKYVVPSSPSSPRSIDSPMYSSTSTSIPSNIMQKSLSAAEKAQGRQKSDVMIHIIRKSNDPSSGSDSLQRHSQHGNPLDSPSTSHHVSISDSVPLKNSKLIAHVNHALKEAEHGDSMPPPLRKPSFGGSGNMAHLSSRYAHTSPDTKVWSCGDLLSGRNHKQYAMIVLNQPITRKDIFLRAWKSSESRSLATLAYLRPGELRFCADGGANRLFDIWNSEHRSA